MSYFYIPQRWTTRRLEQHPRRFRALWKIKRQQPPTLPRHCSKSPACSLDFNLVLLTLHLGHFFVPRFAQHFGDNHQCLQSFIFHCPDSPLPDPAFRTGAFFSLFMQLWFFPGLNVPVKHQGFCLQVGHSRKLHHCLRVYHFSLFQVLTSISA